MKKVARHFEDLEYLNTINIQCSEILSNVTKCGRKKPAILELIDVRFGRSTLHHSFIQFIITSHCQRTGIIIASP